MKDQLPEKVIGYCIADSKIMLALLMYLLCF